MTKRAAAACTCGADHSETGRFYIAVESGSKFGLVAGPYSVRADACADVEAVRTLAEELDPYAWFYTFGTVKIPVGADGSEYNKPGILNDRLVEFLAARAAETARKSEVR